MIRSELGLCKDLGAVVSHMIKSLLIAYNGIEITRVSLRRCIDKHG